MSKKKNIYKGSWWFNNKRKHPSFIVKSNNKDYFVVRILSHSKDRDDFILYDSPNPQKTRMPQYISSRKYYENNKAVFGKHYPNIKLTYKDKKRFNNWNKKR